MAPKSWVWKHFSKLDDGNVQCNHCRHKLSIKGGTTTLRYHLEKTHTISKPPEEQSKFTIKLPAATSISCSSSQGSISADNVNDPLIHAATSESDDGVVEYEIDTSCRDASGRMVRSSSVKEKGAKLLGAQGQGVLSDWVSVSSKRPCTANRASELTKLAVNCVVRDLQPLSFCEDSGMTAFLLFMEPNYQPPTHKTMREHLMKIYDVKRTDLISKLKGTEMSITVDGWTNSKMVGFFSVMGHFITANWDMKSYNLDSPTIDGRHTGENLAEVIDATLQDWEIDCFTCVHDTAANMNKSLRLSKQVLYDFGCLAHILQLAINDAFKETNDGEIADLIGKVRDVIKFKGKSENLSREIRKYRDQLLPDMNKRELQMDCDTRWNSTFMMLESFLKLQTAVDLAVKNVCKEENKQKFYFTPDEITLLTDVVSMLELLKGTTDQWQGQKYVTISTIYPVIFQVIASMEKSSKFCPSAEDLKKALISNVKERLSMEDDVFLGSMCIPMIASYLDPRFKKLKFVKQKVVKSIIAIVREEIVKLSPPTVSSTNTDSDSDAQPPTKKSFIEKIMGDQDEDSDPEACDDIAEYDRLQHTKVGDNPLVWWRRHQAALPRLAKLARRYLAIPATSASSERLFSAYGLVYEQRRMCLAKETAAAIVFLHENSDT